jgi:hypothetical protein
MSVQRRFALDDSSSSEDTSSEDFHYSSSEDQRGSPPPIHDFNSYDQEGSEIEEESMDYEGRDTILPVSEYRQPAILPPFGHGFSHMGKLQIYKNSSLLDQSDSRAPQSFGLRGLQVGDDDEDYGIDVEDKDYRNSEPDDERDENRSSASQDDGRNENIDGEAGGAIEVEEPFISKPITVSVLPKSRKLVPLGEDVEISLDESFPPGYEIHRSFRVGWGPNGSLIIPRRANFEKKKQDMDAETYGNPITISKIQVFNNAHTPVHLNPLPETNIKKQNFSNEIFLLEKHLQLSQKKKVNKPNDLTYFTVANPDDLIKVNREGSPSKENYQYDSEIWYLVEMLWGTPSDIFANDPSSSYSHQLYRRNALSRWFSDTTAAAAEDDLRKLPDGLNAEEKECFTIFQLLTTKKISEAVDVALQNKDFRFAALVSQAASGNALFKKNIESQVIQWNNMKAFDAVNSFRQYIYHVLSGEIKGGANLVDWKRGLALYFWYGRDASMKYDKFDTLQLALSLYDTACKKHEARRPYPNYLLNSAYNGQKEDPEVYDLSYHLLQLFSHPATYPIRKVLQPKNYDEHLYNYHLSWHLHKILRAIIDDNVMDFEGLEQWNLLDYEVTMNYAFQLETMGHWEWALYVLLNIYSPFENLNVRFSQLLPQTMDDDEEGQHSHYAPKIGSTYIVEHAFRELLSRHVPDFDEQKRLFLTKDLQIPETWIKAAEATYQHYKKNYRAELELLIGSEQWEAAHTVLMNHLLYQLILHEKTEELTLILEKLNTQKHQLKEWFSRGGLFLNYLKLIDTCKVFIPGSKKKDDEMLVSDLNQTLQKIQAWEKNNSSIPKNLLQEACIGEMSSVIHFQISIIKKNQESINVNFNRAHIELQALPNDLVKNHLDLTLTQFVRNVTRI